MTAAIRQRHAYQQRYTTLRVPLTGRTPFIISPRLFPFRRLAAISFQPQRLGSLPNVRLFSAFRPSPTMCISEKFTPEAMLGAPRRSPAVPNHDGTLALYTVSTYDFAEGKKTTELKVTNIQTGDSRVLSSGDSIVEALWLPGRNEVICLVKADKGVTRLVVTGACQSVEEGQSIAEFDGELRGVKLKRLGDDTLAFAAVGLVGDDGKLFNEKKEEKRSTARIFDTAQVWLVSISPYTVVISKWLWRC